MIKIQFVLWAYKADRALVELNLRHFTQVRGTLEKEAGIVTSMLVADDAAFPCFNSREAALKAGANEWMMTGFDRGSRLDGKEALSGMLATYKDISVRNDAPDWICQLDADTLIQHFGWITDCKNEIAITGCGGDHTGCMFLYGPTLAIHASAIPILVNLALRDDVQTRLDRGMVYTDRAITGLARMAGLREMMWRMPSPPFTGPVNAVKFYPFEAPHENGLERYSHLVFEKRSLSSHISLPERISICAQAMENYINTHSPYNNLTNNNQ